MLNAHNDKQSGQFKLSLAEGDLEDAARVKDQLEDDNNAKRSELNELRTKFVRNCIFLLAVNITLFLSLRI